jgi:uncharacterized protein YbjQ (UPF0145 family)
MELLINLGLTLGLLVGAYFTGTYLEHRHFESIRAREAQTRNFPTVTFAQLPTNWEVASSGLVTGNVVISLDYFKRFLASLRMLFGGRIRVYEPLLDRARREAVLRMIESARAGGYQAVVNVRLETSRLASSRGNGEGTAGVEMLAFGTGVRLARHG